MVSYYLCFEFNQIAEIIRVVNKTNAMLSLLNTGAGELFLGRGGGGQKI